MIEDHSCMRDSAICAVALAAAASMVQGRSRMLNSCSVPAPYSV